MFYCNLEHTAKKATKTLSGKVKNPATAKNRFHYITRTSHFRNYKESAEEQIEFVKSGNMPNFAEGKPAVFWNAADVYERSNGRTCSSLIVALPKELNQQQRIELAEQFIVEFADRYCYPFTCAIHNHAGAIGGQEQPHLHFMYSERHVDGIDRTEEQFFKRYNAKDPQKGGAQKLTADVLGMGKAQLQLYRQKTEELINASLEQYAPMKKVEIKGIVVEVPSLVSCLSHRDYNKKHGTNLKDVPVMTKAIRFARKNEPDLLAKQQEMIEEIKRIRAENNYELYQSYYKAELKRCEDAKKIVETDRTRAYTSNTERVSILHEQMLQTLSWNPHASNAAALIHADLLAYVDTLNSGSFDRLTKFQYLTELHDGLSRYVTVGQGVLEQIDFISKQVSSGKKLEFGDLERKVEKSQDQDPSNDWSGPSF
jgi:hypothetical protein